MNRIFLILLFTVLKFSSSQTIDEKCVDEVSTDEKICLIFLDVVNEEKMINYFKACPTGYSCKEVLYRTSQQIVQGCILPYKKREEGTSCELSAQCITNYCKDKICTARINGEECNDDLECEKTSICKNKKCKPASKEGEECDSSYDCLAGYSCGKNVKDPSKKSICIEDYSLKSGSYVEGIGLCESNWSQDSMCYDIEPGNAGKACKVDSDCKGVKIANGV